MTDRPEMFAPTRGFSGMADSKEPCTMLWDRPLLLWQRHFGNQPLLREEFRLPELILHSDLRPRAASRLALPCTSSFFFLLSPASLRRPSTDRRETLSHDRKLVRLNKFSPKIRGALPPPQKNGGPKTCKISGNFLPLLTLSPERRNISTYELAKFFLRLMKKVR